MKRVFTWTPDSIGSTNFNGKPRTLEAQFETMTQEFTVLYLKAVWTVSTLVYKNIITKMNATQLLGFSTADYFLMLCYLFSDENVSVLYENSIIEIRLKISVSLSKNLASLYPMSMLRRFSKENNILIVW